MADKPWNKDEIPKTVLINHESFWLDSTGTVYNDEAGRQHTPEQVFAKLEHCCNTGQPFVLVFKPKQVLH